MSWNLSACTITPVTNLILGSYNHWSRTYRGICYSGWLESLYHYHLTSVWTLHLAVCLQDMKYYKPQILLFKHKSKTEEKKNTLKHAGYYFFVSCRLIPWRWSEWVMCVCVCCVNVHVLFTRAVQACWHVDILVLYFQRRFRAYEKISFMFL